MTEPVVPPSCPRDRAAPEKGHEDWEHPYAAFLERLQKPARYAGGELGRVRKDWSAVRARVCLAFPDLYEVGMSHLGYQILYQLLNADPRTLAERCYCPWSDLEAELRQRALPLVSLESFRPLSDFDVVGFSLQHELTYTNVLTMLDLGGVSLRASERQEGDPLVLGGGPTALHPEPVADFFDAFVVGDGEAKLSEVALCWTDLARRGISRSERLRALAALGAVYVPSLYPTRPHRAHGMWVVERPADEQVPFPVQRAVVNLEDFPFPATGPTGGPEAIFDRTSIELARGCLEGCRFCQAGMTYRPLREREPTRLRETVQAALRHTGDAELSLTALSPADVSTLRPLLLGAGRELAEQGVSLGVSSLRAYGLEPALLDELRRVRAAGLTFAPEAGTQRLRDVINKNVTEQQLQDSAEQVCSRGWTRMKLYFMIGLPTETDEDVRAIIECGARAAAVGRKAAGRRVRVTVSVSTHVPKPHTPFQWEAMLGQEEVRRRQGLLREQVRAHRAVKLRTHDSRASVLEGALARGDRRLGAVVEAAWRAGARFDSWDEHLELERWHAAFAEHGIEPSSLLAALPLDAPLPWDHIDVGVERDFLVRERRRAQQARSSPPCGRPAKRRSNQASAGAAGSSPVVCYDCGLGCDLETMAQAHRVSAALDMAPAATAASEPPGVLAAAAVGEADSALAAPAEPRSPAPADPSQSPGPPTGHRYCFRYQKTGPAALLGHLDLVRELPRVFRRLGIRMVHTAGFHPKPAMAFGPALALGVPSLDEQVDVRLEAELDRDAFAALLERMTEVSPQGLCFVAATQLGPSSPSVTRRISAVRYVLGFEPPVTSASLAQRSEALLALESAVVERRGKKGQRTVDLRPFLLSFRAVGELSRQRSQSSAVAPVRGARAELTALPAEAQSPGQTDEQLLRALGPTCIDLAWLGDLVLLEVDLAVTPYGTVRPAEIATILFRPEPVPAHRIARVRMLSLPPTDRPDSSSCALGA